MPAGLLSASAGQHPWSRRRKPEGGCIQKATKCCLDSCFRHRSPNFFLLIIAVCALLYILFYIYISNQIIIDDQYEGAVNADVLRQKKDFSQVIVARTCSKTTSLCYKVVDSVMSGGNPSDVQRELFTVGAGEFDSETLVLLSPKEPGASFDTSDTRFWSVSHSKVLSSYVTGLAVAPFVFGPIPLKEEDPNARKPFQVLSIGLGGGNLDMFWNNLHKNLNQTVVELDEAVVRLGREWFGVEESEARRTVVGDGVVFVKEAAARGAKFDVVVVDACDLDTKLPCPAAPFLHHGVIQAIHSIVTDDGVLVINVLPLAGESNPQVEEALAPVRSIFSSCFEMHVERENNVIVSCTKKTVPIGHEYLLFVEKRMEAALASLGLGDVVSRVERAKKKNPKLT